MGRRVREVMTLEVVTVGEQASFKETAATMAEHRVSALPVLDVQGRVAGIVSEADLLLKEEFPEGPAGGRLFQGRRKRVERAKAAGDTPAELMTAPAVTIGPDATVTEAATLLHRHGIKRMPVVDPAGRRGGPRGAADGPQVPGRPAVHQAIPSPAACPAPESASRDLGHPGAHAVVIVDAGSC
jgi:CBS-domain-containing membrane protein